MPPPANDNSSHRFAYALVSPPSDSPGFLLRRAFEEHGGNPFVGLAAIDFGAMLVLFPSVEVREATLQLFPLYLMAMTSPWRSQRRGTTGSAPPSPLSLSSRPPGSLWSIGMKVGFGQHFAPLVAYAASTPFVSMV
jgi:hypothetical protein